MRHHQPLAVVDRVGPMENLITYYYSYLKIFKSTDIFSADIIHDVFIHMDIHIHSRTKIKACSVLSLANFWKGPLNCLLIASITGEAK